MDCTIRVVNEKGREMYIKEISGVNNYRQILNKLRRARNIIDRPHVSEIHIAGDKHAFRVGCEEDTAIWLKERIKKFKPIKMVEDKTKGGDAGDFFSVSSVEGVTE
jgi:hypothetical protein